MYADIDPNTLILVDSGCSVESLPFPERWNGVPPKTAVKKTVNLACGDTIAWKYKGILYFNPKDGKCDPLFPLGLYAKQGVWSQL